MRDRNVFNKTRALPRMSWSPHNLYNLWQRTLGPLASESQFTRSNESLFQQRWKAKRLIRGYHGDFIGETKFKRWYLPASLPDVSKGRHNAAKVEQDIYRYAMRNKEVSKEASKRQKEEAEGTAPVGTLFLIEVERRLDVVLFRCCFAPSVYHARHMIIRGGVTVNGKKYINPNKRMEPGDLISVEPDAIPFLRKDALKDTWTYGRVMTGRQAPVQDEVKEAVEIQSEEAKEGQKEEDKEVGTPSEVATPDEARAEAAEPVPIPEPTPADHPSPSTSTISVAAANESVFHLPPYAAPSLFIPAYLEVSFPICSAVYVRHPTARPGYSEIPSPYDADGEVVRLAWEWYSRIRPRMRRKRDLWMSPDRTFGHWKML